MTSADRAGVTSHRSAPLATVRADKWLWAARVFKTRGIAAAACDGGKVDVNDATAKPARPVRVGDTVRVTVSDGKRILRVVALAERRGPAPAARALYDDLTPSAPLRVRVARPVVRAPGAGRPTKRERRQLDRLRGG